VCEEQRQGSKYIFVTTSTIESGLVVISDWGTIFGKVAGRLESKLADDNLLYFWGGA
jgi:hypothetical protein